MNRSNQFANLTGMIFLTVVGCSLTQMGCHGDQMAPVYATTKPSPESLIGKYKIKIWSIREIEDPRPQMTLSLSSDGKFRGTNLPPPVLGLFPAEFLSLLVKGEGTWKLDEFGSLSNGDRIWGVDLGERFHAPMVISSDVSYDLIFVFGDPDSSRRIVMTRQEDEED